MGGRTQALDINATTCSAAAFAERMGLNAPSRGESQNRIVWEMNENYDVARAPTYHSEFAGGMDGDGCNPAYRVGMRPLDLQSNLLGGAFGNEFFGAFFSASTTSGQFSDNLNGDRMATALLYATGNDDEEWDVGTFQIGNIAQCAWDDNPVQPQYHCDDGVNNNGVNVVAYDWLGTGFEPLWSPRVTHFDPPEWDNEIDAYLAPLLIGNMVCTFARADVRPMVLVAEDCMTASAGPLSLEMEFDH